jgi:spermidine/putrescine-binding protein
VRTQTLHLLHAGFNTTRADLASAGISLDDARDAVRALRRQARLFSCQDHVRALLAGDVWLAVGSSSDLVLLGERTPSVELLAPADGTSLWADIWCVPARASHGHLQSGPSPILPSWLEFCTSPARADVLAGLK